ncbi:hypothetical protein AAVH_37510, partial [Aphelenchoides avenae]
KLLEVSGRPRTSMAAVASDFAEYRVICDFLTAAGVLECFDVDSRELCVSASC